MDWLSRLFEMMPVRGRLDLRCSYGAPWRIDQGPGEAHEIPYHAVVVGSAVVEDPAGGRAPPLEGGDSLGRRGNAGWGRAAAAEGRRHSASSRKSAAGPP